MLLLVGDAMLNILERRDLCVCDTHINTRVLVSHTRREDVEGRERVRGAPTEPPRERGHAEYLAAE